MYTVRHLETEFGLSGVRTAADPLEQQRPLGKAYRLILSYEPKRKAPAEGNVGAATPKTDDVQSATG